MSGANGDEPMESEEAPPAPKSETPPPSKEKPSHEQEVHLQFHERSFYKNIFCFSTSTMF